MWDRGLTLGRYIWKMAFWLVVLFHFPATCWAADQVLILNSYHQDLHWVRDITDVVTARISAARPQTRFFIENMDAKHFFHPAYLDRFHDLIKEKYKETRFNLIVVSDNNAFEFLLRHREDLFPGVPVVFCGVNNYEDSWLKGQSRITGVAEVFDAKGTVELARTIQPDLSNVWVINDYLLTGIAWTEDIKRELKEFESVLAIDYSENLPMSELEKRLGRLGPDSMVLLGVYFQDKNGRYFETDETSRRIAAASSVPVYCLLDFNIVHGVVGGRVINGRSQGEAASDLALRILGGENADHIPVVKKALTKTIMDYQAARAHGLPLGSLPMDTVLLNRPATFYEKHKRIIWPITVVVLTETVIILMLVSSLARLRKTQRDRKRTEERYKYLYDSMLDGYAQTNLDGRIVQCNDAFLGIIEYPKEKIIGVKELDITPEKWWGVERETILKQVNERGFSNIFEKEYIRMNGRTVPVELRIYLLKDETGRAEGYWAIIRDITQRKISEQKLIEFSEELEKKVRLRTEELQTTNNRLEREILERKAVEETVRQALAEIKTLRGFLPICAHCKKIRNDEGYWQQIEQYVTDHTEAVFSHGICPDCLKKLYPDMKVSRRTLAPKE